MTFTLILPNYFVWHYTTAFRDIVRVWTNFIWFFSNFFSISLLLRTFFAPWKRIQEERSREGFNFEDIAEVVLMNTVMRFVGAVIRLIFIGIGSVIILVVFWIGLLFLALWVFIPVIVPVSFVYGLLTILGIA